MGRTTGLAGRAYLDIVGFDLQFNGGGSNLDYFSAMVDERGFLKDELTNDGIHANDKGYAVMAPLAEAAIERAVKLSSHEVGS